MFERKDFIVPGAVLLLMLGAFGIAASGPAWAVDTDETPASQADPEFGAARALVDAQRYGDALAALKALDAKSPGNPDVLNLIGFSLRKTGHMDAALDFYNKALALNPDHLGANEYLGELYLETKQPAKAKERLATLRRVCGNCEEYLDLQTKIEQTAKME